ncbi:lipocalin family protein [Frigidibacter sp. MR17.14]|uniref:lipocalin family protein n=1 Tax=Frigidibacter sp. MR17.14 TaxID=3126509 RepID=UPI003012A2D2
MHRLTLAAALLTGLAACAPKPPPVPPVVRDTRAFIASQALFDPARFAGDWYVVADVPPPGRARCAITREHWQGGPGGFAVSGVACGPRGPAKLAGVAHVTGPGRITPGGEGRPDWGTEPIWVLWMDADARVAALGTPSGRFGAIVSRQPTARGDLVAAAREAMAFNGYPLAALRPR